MNNTKKLFENIDKNQKINQKFGENNKNGIKMVNK